jgi:hypothetical protein
LESLLKNLCELDELPNYRQQDRSFLPFNRQRGNPVCPLHSTKRIVTTTLHSFPGTVSLSLSLYASLTCNKETSIQRRCLSISFGNLFRYPITNIERKFIKTDIHIDVERRLSFSLLMLL